MRLLDLFLTEDGVLKLGCYGLRAQAECCSVKKMDCNGPPSNAPDREDETSDVWLLGFSLIRMMGFIPQFYTVSNDLATGK